MNFGTATYQLGVIAGPSSTSWYSSTRSRATTPPSIVTSGVPRRLRSTEFEGLMTPSRLQARAKNCRGRWLTVMGFGAQARNEGRGADVPALTTQSRLLRGPL